MDVSGTIDEDKRSLWLRALYMLLCVIFYGLAEAVLTVLVIVQFLMILFTGAAQQGLLQLGSQLSLYNYQIIRFVTFNTEERPFPWGPWPDDESAASPWHESNRASPTSDRDQNEASAQDPGHPDVDTTASTDRGRTDRDEDSSRS